MLKVSHQSKTTVGVIGSTGVGKSSLINALLGIGRLVPADCVGACTAVPIEISYLEEDGLYRAEIEFISEAEWEKELQLIIPDLFDMKGNLMRDTSSKSTDAGVALAKFKAVYPGIRLDSVKDYSFRQNSRDSEYLDKTESIREDDLHRFTERLQHYVATPKKPVGKSTAAKDTPEENMQFWPLIRVVKIFIKSPVLRSGLVIVDLPGTQDTNAARAAAAKEYQKQCDGTWIVAPIIRAVDDRIAYNLLGDSFKRQLQMDGELSSITMICSKTDDFNIEELLVRFGSEERCLRLESKVQNLRDEEQSLNGEIETCQIGSSNLRGLIKDIERQIRTLNLFQSRIENGELIPPSKPARKTLKRKRDEGSYKPSSRDTIDIVKLEDEMELVHHVDLTIKDNKTSTCVANTSLEQMRPDLIRALLSDLQETNNNVKERRSGLIEEVEIVRDRIEKLKRKQKIVEGEKVALCVSERNELTKLETRQHFEDAMEDLRAEAAEEANAEHLNKPENRVSEEVLPVFCVCSMSYQQLSGCFKRTPSISGFRSLEDTEIPQLRAHCHSITKNGRLIKSRSFLLRIGQLLNSIYLWASQGKFTPGSLDSQRELEKGLRTSLVCLKNVRAKYECTISILSPCN